MDWAIQSGAHVGHWTAERLGCLYFEAGSQAIGLVRDGVIIAGTIFENWNGASIVAHMAIEGRLTREFIAAIFSYAYGVGGVSKVICPIVETNTRSVAFAKNLGFTEEARLRDCSPQGDIVLFTLRKADCRFLGSYGHRKVSTLPASGS